MKLASSTVKKIVISDIKGLDPISIYLEDYAKGQGKLIITCYDKSWTYYWGSMGDSNLAQFIITCDNQYLSKKLAPDTKSNVDDFDGLEEYAKKHIIERRREDIIDADTARNLYHDCDYLVVYKDTDSEAYSNLMYEIFGDEWWDCLPTKINPDYEYLCRILDAVKEGLKTI